MLVQLRGAALAREAQLLVVNPQILQLWQLVYERVIYLALQSLENRNFRLREAVLDPREPQKRDQERALQLRDPEVPLRHFLVILPLPVLVELELLQLFAIFAFHFDFPLPHPLRSRQDLRDLDLPPVCLQLVRNIRLVRPGQRAHQVERRCHHLELKVFYRVLQLLEQVTRRRSLVPPRKLARDCQVQLHGQVVGQVQQIAGVRELVNYSHRQEVYDHGLVEEERVEENGRLDRGLVRKGEGCLVSLREELREVARAELEACQQVVDQHVPLVQVVQHLRHPLVRLVHVVLVRLEVQLLEDVVLAQKGSGPQLVDLEPLEALHHLARLRGRQNRFLHWSGYRCAPFRVSVREVFLHHLSSFVINRNYRHSRLGSSGVAFGDNS